MNTTKQQNLKIIRESVLSDKDGLSRTARRELIARGEYPEPIVLMYRKNGAAAVMGWLEHEVDAWLQHRVETQRRVSRHVAAVNIVHDEVAQIGA